MSPPWAFAAVALLIGASLILDLALAKRYAGGRNHHDGVMWGLLVISLGGNMTLAIALSLSGVGLIGWKTDLVAATGVALGVAGLALRYGAIFALGRQFTWRVTILDGHRLVTRGLFARVRHPSYTGGLLAAVGIILILGNWLALALFCATHVPLVLRRIMLEEIALARHFREAYVAYCDRTWKLVPFVY